MKRILQITVLISALFIASGCRFQQSASVEAMPEEAGSTQVETVYVRLTPPSASSNDALDYPEAVVDPQSVMNHPREAAGPDSSLLSFWTGPNGLFIQYIYLR
jgi:hypothetical protein